MQPRLVGGMACDLTARAQPHPLAARVPHAEIVVDRFGLAVGELAGDLIEFDVVGMHQRVDLAEGQQFVARVEPEDGEHRVRPEDAPACEVPVPQAAAAAVERGIDAPAHHIVDDVGFACPRRLPVKRKAEDQHHETSGRRERDGERRVGAREVQCRRVRLDNRELSERSRERPHGGKGLRAVGERNLQHAGGGAECGQRLTGAERIKQQLANGGCLRNPGDYQAVRIRDQELDTRFVALPICLVENIADAARQLRLGQAIVAAEPFGQEVSGEVEIAHHIGDRLPAVVIDLHQRAHRHCQQECDDQDGNSPPQRRFCIEQTAIRWLRDGLREPFDRIRTC